MPQLKWTGSGIFTDNPRDFEARPGGVYNVSDEQADHYLNHDQFGDDWEDASAVDADDTEEVVEGTAATAAGDTPHATSDSDADEDDDGDSSESADAPLSPGDYTVDELESELSDGDYSDEELDAILEDESSNEDRESAKDAIESQKG